MKKITRVLLIVFLILLAIKLYAEYLKISIPYVKPEIEVNFTEPELGEIVVPLKKVTKQVLFDQAHQDLHSIYSDYSKFASLFGEAGFTIKSLDVERIKSLEDVDVLVLLTPNISYSRDEIENIKDALNNGITLILIGEGNSAEILNKLSLSFGIIFNKDYVYDLQSYSVLYKNPIISDFKYTALEESIYQIVIYQGCSLDTFDLATPIAFTSKTARSSTGIEGSLSIAAISAYKAGKIFAICDSDIFSNKFIRNFDNENFARNLVNWS